MRSIPSVIISDASAGSGKTELLTLHYVSLLFFPLENSSTEATRTDKIMAITFTNEAAREMKQRILEWLKLASLGTPEIIKKIRGHLLRLTSNSRQSYVPSAPILTDQDISRLALKNLEHILDDYHALHVHTIDSFVNSIAASSALEMGLPPNYEIISDVPNHINMALDEMLSSQDGAIYALLEKFLKSYLYLERNKQWNPRRAIYENIKFLYDEENHRGKNFKPSTINEEDIIKERDFLVKKFYEAALDCPDLRSRASMVRKLSSVNKQGALEDLSEAQLGYIPQDLRARLGRYYENFSAARFNSYIDVYAHFRRIMEGYKNARRMVFISDLNSRVASRLQTMEVPSIYFMLGERIEHFLIDEFQDTSEIQWRNIMPLAENSVASGGTLFYVGDKKQSLYRWRGGRAALFDTAADDISSPNMPRAHIDLNTNYRSCKAIIDFINNSFSVEKLSSLGLSPSQLATYEKARQKLPDGKKENDSAGSVQVTKISAANNDELEEKVREYILRSLKDMLAPNGKFSLSDIAILTRKNKEVRKITRWLLTESIPVISATSMSLKENPAILEIINFLKVLVKPSDDVAFASVLRGKIFRNFSRLREKEISDFLVDNRRIKGRKSESASLYEVFQQNYPDIHQKLFLRYSCMAGYMSPYDLVSLYLNETSSFKLMPDEEIFFIRLLEILNERDDEIRGAGDLKDFLDYWAQEEQQQGDDERGSEVFEVKLFTGSINAVRVSTIHKAKGLGFRAVIMPFKPSLDNTNNKIVVERNSDGDLHLSLNYIIEAYTKESDFLKSIDENEEKEKMLDEINTAYVGVTRAKEELRLALLETAKSRNPFVKIFDETAEPAGTPIMSVTPVSPKVADKRGRSKKLENFLQDKSEKFSLWWEKIVRDKKSDESDLITADDKRLAEIERGNILHKTLSLLRGPVPVGDRTEIRQMLRAAADRALLCATKEDTSVSAAEILAALEPLFEIEEFSLWFSYRGENEKEISDSRGRIFRMDRMVELDGTVYIIDYKTGEEYSDRHVGQIAGYGKLVSKILGADKKIALRLVYIDERRIVRI